MSMRPQSQTSHILDLCRPLRLGWTWSLTSGTNDLNFAPTIVRLGDFIASWRERDTLRVFESPFGVFDVNTMRHRLFECGEFLANFIVSDFKL